MAYFGLSQQMSVPTMPKLHNINFHHGHDKREFAKLTKISNYINTIEHIVNVCKTNNDFPCEAYGVELLEKLKYILELRLGSDGVVMNNVSILIGESIDHILTLAHEYIKTGKYSINETLMSKQYTSEELQNLDDYSKTELIRHGFGDTELYNEPKTLITVSAKIPEGKIPPNLPPIMMGTQE